MRATDRPAATYAASVVARVRPIRRFVLFASARSGSELLVSYLRGHPDVVCDSEIFEHPRLRPGAYINGRAAVAALIGSKAYGFKVTFEHLRWNERTLGPGRDFLQRFRDRGDVVIFLDRQAILLQALSHMHIELMNKGVVTRKKGHYRAEEGFKFEAYDVDPAELIARLVWHDEYARWAQETVDGLANVVLDYEHDFEHPSGHQGAADRVFAALGLPSVAVTSPLVKVTPSDARDRVKNWDEVADVISRTRFAALLD